MIDSSEKKLFDSMTNMTTGFARAQELYTTVKLGIADLLAKCPRESNDLAEELKINQPSIFRFLRLLEARGILYENNDKKFGLTPLGELLRSDHPRSMRDIILYHAEISYRVWQEMLYSIETGKPAFDKIFGMPFFDYLHKNPEMGSSFNSTMIFHETDRFQKVVSNYNFKQAISVVDIGGGDATLISLILKNNQQSVGIVFDIPTFTAAAQKNIAQNNLLDRCQVIIGDFFQETIPEGKDIYILSNIIHDWADKEAILILRNCQKAMCDNSKLLIIEQIMPENVTDDPQVVSSDFSMLLITGGLERTLQEYKTLLAEVKLIIINVITFEQTCYFDKDKKTNWAIMECALEHSYKNGIVSRKSG